ncbi:MAG: xanthine dehydrogenase family protein molybdopterin-binding subunit [Xanthobacteraceae bacterium]
MDSKTRGPAQRVGPFIGQPLPRFEDRRFVRGAGRFTDDVALPGQTYAVFVRSPHAHARLLRVDAQAARACPGVLAILTGDDYTADGHVGIPQAPMPADAVDYRQPAFVAKPPRAILNVPQLPLAVERVRYVGEAVAIIVAETLFAARDAAERVIVEYEIRTAIVDVLDAVVPGAPALRLSAPDNIAVEAEHGDRDATLAAISGADLIVEQAFRNQRVANAQMEPRSAIGSYDPAESRYTLISGSQGVHRQRQALATCLGVPHEQVRVICPDVGGGFGLRTNLYPEQIAVVWAARRIGRPVKWTSDRSEAFLTDFQGRDLVTKAQLALDHEGRIRALSLELLGNIGAHTVSYVPLNNGMRIATTVYDVPTAWVRVRAVLTNTVPTAPYRGAGRPEATFVIERLLDIAARKLNIGRAEIRRRNLIRRDRLPYRNAMGLTYDSGDFAANMERVLALADWDGFPARRARAKKDGRLLGIGIANYVESPVGAPHERVEVKVASDGSVELRVGTQSTGQGHETSFAQVMADQLGVAPEAIRLVSGDTATIASGGGTHSDRSMRLAGSLMVEAAAIVIVRARRVAARLLDAPEADVAFADGLFFTPRSNRRLSIVDIARAIETDSALPDPLRAPLAGEATFTGRIPAYPTGAAVCELELDPETGAMVIRHYISVDDAGRPINPLILHGQVHGGIAQGIGQAVLEQVVWAETGDVLTGSFLDYGIPRAHLLPTFSVELAEDPTFGNHLRVKGGGESGITPALAAVMNAVLDALSPFGVEHIDVPATPQRIWQVIRGAAT